MLGNFFKNNSSGCPRNWERIVQLERYWAFDVTEELFELLAAKVCGACRRSIQLHAGARISLHTGENQSTNSAHLGTHWVSGSDIFARDSYGTGSPRAIYVCAMRCVLYIVKVLPLES